MTNRLADQIRENAECEISAPLADASWSNHPANSRTSADSADRVPVASTTVRCHVRAVQGRKARAGVPTAARLWAALPDLHRCPAAGPRHVSNVISLHHLFQRAARCAACRWYQERG